MVGASRCFRLGSTETDLNYKSRDLNLSAFFAMIVWTFAEVRKFERLNVLDLHSKKRFSL